MREFTSPGWKIFTYMLLHSWSVGEPHRAFSLNDLSQGAMRIKCGAPLSETLNVDTDSEARANHHGMEREDSGCGLSPLATEDALTVLWAKSFVVRHRWIVTGDYVYLINWKHLGLLKEQK